MESKEYSNSHAYKDYFSISCDSLCSGVVNKDSYNSKIEVEDLEMSKELEELKCMRERLHKIYFDLSSIACSGLSFCCHSTFSFIMFNY